MSGTYPLWQILVGHAPGKSSGPATCGRPQAWRGTHYRTVHPERYNPLKVGDQPQESWAKVRPDFGVRSVTLRAWEQCPTWATDWPCVRFGLYKHPNSNTRNNGGTDFTAACPLGANRGCRLSG